MATTTRTRRGGNTRSRQLKLDPSRPLYAAVGAGDLAVAYARSTASEVQARVGKADLEPRSLRDQALTLINSRIADLQADARALPTRLQQVADDYIAELNKNYAELASRGEGFVARVRRQEATKQTKAAARTTATKAKTTRTQATKAAKTAGSSAKATSTSARKTASAARKATGDAASKAGN